MALVAMLIYVNAFVLVPKLLDRKKTALYITGLNTIYGNIDSSNEIARNILIKCGELFKG